jgi:hypothetical protein
MNATSPMWRSVLGLAVSRSKIVPSRFLGLVSSGLFTTTDRRLFVEFEAIAAFQMWSTYKNSPLLSRTALVLVKSVMGLLGRSSSIRRMSDSLSKVARPRSGTAHFLSFTPTPTPLPSHSPFVFFLSRPLSVFYHFWSVLYSPPQFLTATFMLSFSRSFLSDNADAFADHFETNPKSFMSRFYGCHGIRMYGQLFYFVVQENLVRTFE